MSKFPSERMKVDSPAGDEVGKILGGVKRPREDAPPVQEYTSTAPAAPAAKKPAEPASVFVGERLKILLPDKSGWFDAIISDYNPTTDQHCLTCHINMPEETKVWMHLKVRRSSPRLVCGGVCASPPPRDAC